MVTYDTHPTIVTYFNGHIRHPPQPPGGMGLSVRKAYGRVHQHEAHDSEEHPIGYAHHVEELVLGVHVQ